MNWKKVFMLIDSIALLDQFELTCNEIASFFIISDIYYHLLKLIFIHYLLEVAKLHCIFCYHHHENTSYPICLFMLSEGWRNSTVLLYNFSVCESAVG